MRGEGLVREVFTQSDFKKLRGSIGLGHVRYRTTGSISLSSSQPFTATSSYRVSLIHNGNLTNADSLRRTLSSKLQKKIRSDSDSEVLLMALVDALDTHAVRFTVQGLHAAVQMTMRSVFGAYSVVASIGEKGILAFRDPHGIRPLVLGKRIRNRRIEWAVASESSAFVSAGFELVRDVCPGESLFITKDGVLHSRQVCAGVLNPCIFEYIYLARPDSLMNNISVYKTHLSLGRLLGKQIAQSGVVVDNVIPVPDSGRTVAAEVAHELHRPHREGLYRNRYIGRTFIMPEQRDRALAVRRKLSPLELEIKNRNILLVDDSIVRGTTIKRIIQMCREAGAKKVYVASAAPPVRFQNVYGVDIPTKEELVAHGKTEKEIAKAIGADGVFYQSIEDMYAAAREGNDNISRFEDSVFTGNYVTGGISEEYLQKNASARKKNTPK